MGKKQPPAKAPNLSRREQQIISVVYARQSATTEEVIQDIPDAPSYSSIRKIMQIMVGKGFLTYRRVGLKYVYEPVLDASQVQRSALTRLIGTLFNNSPASAIAAMLEAKDLSISQDEIEQLKQLIAKKSAQNAK